MRNPWQLQDDAMSVIDMAFFAGAREMIPLLSGGYDSLSACLVASKHKRFTNQVYHIDTGIGSKRTRQYVDEVCKEIGWTLNVFRSKETYEKFVRERGFPGPGRHHWVYVRIKDRAIRQMLPGRQPRALITGCRKEESKRRMGNVEPIKIGEVQKNGKVVDKKRIWTAPCHDWTKEEQRLYLDEHDMPRNPVKDSPIGMSGECFCGAFARPGEIEMIRHHCPDVADEIDRLAVIAKECGKHDVWGTAPPKQKKGLTVVESGPLCSACDRRALAAGIVFKDESSGA